MYSAAKTSCQPVDVTFLVGLPGSGKTKYADQVFKGAVIADDAHRIKDITKVVQAAIADKKHCVIIDPLLCYQHIRRSAEVWLKEHKFLADWIYFANEPQACIENVLRRQANGDARKVLGFIQDATKGYAPPTNAKVIPVYRR